MMDIAKVLSTMQKVAKDPRPYVVAAAPVCLVIGSPLAITGFFMLVSFGFSAVGVAFTVGFAVFFLAAALIFLTLGLLPLAVAAWAFKPKEFKFYSNKGILSTVKGINAVSILVDPGKEAPTKSPYIQIHKVRCLVVTVIDKCSAVLKAVNDKIQKTAM